MQTLFEYAGAAFVVFLSGVVVGHSIREDNVVKNPFEVAGGDER